MAKVTFNGEPGSTWTNEGDRVQYQLIVSWRNSCGVCCQYDRAVGPSWPIPFHRNCRCKQIIIYPGSESRPFVDFRAKIAELAPAEQSRVVGRSNLTLVESGLADWSDVVTKGRIKDFHQVVAEKKLTVKQMVKAGVNPRLARRAYDSVHTPAHRQAATRQKELVAKLKALGVERDALTKAVAERLAARVGIGAGPSGPQTLGITPGTPGGHAGTAARRGARTRRVTVAERAEYLKKSGVATAVAGRTALREGSEAEAARLKAEATAHARRLADLEAKRKAEAETKAKAKVATATTKAKVATGPAELTRQEILDQVGSPKPWREAERDFYDWVAANAGPAKPGAYHGMSQSEDFHAVRFEGVNYHFTLPGTFNPDAPPPILDQLRFLANARIPRGISGHTTDVYLSSQRNYSDSHWEKAYNRPGFKSLATGANGQVVVYNSSTIDSGSLVHEMGHNLADATYHSARPPESSPFGRALRSAEQPWTDYARNSPAEDFAESVREYWQQPLIMKQSRPLRYQAIDDLVRQSGAEAAP